MSAQLDLSAAFQTLVRRFLSLSKDLSELVLVFVAWIHYFLTEYWSLMKILFWLFFPSGPWRRLPGALILFNHFLGSKDSWNFSLVKSTCTPCSPRKVRCNTVLAQATEYASRFCKGRRAGYNAVEKEAKSTKWESDRNFVMRTIVCHSAHVEPEWLDSK